MVDNHQVPFADLMEKRGHAVVVNSRAELFDKLNLALANPSLFRSAEPYVAALRSRLSSFLRLFMTFLRVVRTAPRVM